MMQKEPFFNRDELFNHLKPSFSLNAPLSDSETLIELLHQTLDQVEGLPVSNFGTIGNPMVRQSSSIGNMHFLYRPHLFPEMDPTLKLGHLVQYMLLPRDLPDKSPVEIATMLESYCHLSGDLFGWEFTSDDNLLVWLIDVSGHGVRAGFAAVIFKLILNHLNKDQPLIAFIEELERVFLSLRQSTDTRSLFATGLFLKVCHDGPIEYVSAGHPPMLLRTKEGQIKTLHRTCLPLTLFPSIPKKSACFELHDGDHLLLYTDGLLELENETGEIFGMDRIHSCLQKRANSPAQLLEALSETIATFHDLSRINDDLSFMILEPKAKE